MPKKAPSKNSKPVPPPPRAATPAPPPIQGGFSTTSLLKLEKPFDIDEFAQLLGESKITVTVPRESLAEVLKRVVEFMGFGIYVYAVVVLPAPSTTLDKFTLSLDRIDFDPKLKGWTPFKEKGRSDSPFGPDGRGQDSRAAPH